MDLKKKRSNLKNNLNNRVTMKYKINYYKTKLIF